MISWKFMWLSGWAEGELHHIEDLKARYGPTVALAAAYRLKIELLAHIGDDATLYAELLARVDDAISLYARLNADADLQAHIPL